MLQIAPDANVERETRAAEPDEIYCAACGALITRTKWRVSRGGGHEHVFFNPAGVVFRVVCFKEAPGVGAHGAPSDEFTWFKGYEWQVGFCRGCGGHIGWRFTGDDEIFFGLIKPKLTTEKRDSA